MSKPKYRPGELIHSIGELSEQEFIYCNHKILHKGWFESWSIMLAKYYILHNALRKAYRLKNKEYYPNMTYEKYIKKHHKSDGLQILKGEKETDLRQCYEKWMEADVE